MRQVRMRTLAAGPFGVLPAGGVVDLEDETAGQLIAAGAAEEILPEEEAEDAQAVPAREGTETATAEGLENAMLPAPRRRNPVTARRRRN